MQPDPQWTTETGLHEAVARTARHRPGAIALVSGHRAVSYGELDRTADAWAASLGTGAGDLVPITLPRSVELVTALLAVLKTGAAYALLDPAWPAGRLREAIRQLDPPLLVTRPGGVEVPGLPAWTPPSRPDGVPGFRPAAVGGSAPCCVFFTSGTTGTPKGVLVPHRATARLFRPGTFARFSADTVVPLAAPVPWDAFSLELWSVLLNGGTSVIVDEPFLSASSLRDGIGRHGVDTVWLTSSLFNMIVDESPEAFGGLHQVMIGGERLSPGHVARFLRRHPGITLLNGYGPVESTVFATTHRITPPDCDRPGGIPLGRPVPGTEVHVLDGGRPCAPGETGEICLAGDGLALRYLGPPELTDAKFTTIRLEGRPLRLYQTGDLGEWDADGVLHFRGRADRQVKIRGHRVEPAEVERQIERLLPAVRTCRVLARRDDGGSVRELLAFCVPAAPDGAMATLRAALLPHHRPSALIAVDAFPVTSQGKLDERALLAMAEEPAEAELAPAHEDPLVRLVAETFGAVLGRPSVPADVPFTDLGGGSLDAGRVCARLTGRLGRAVPVSRLYQHPTALALAGWLGTSPPPAPPEADDGTPLTPMQLVFLTRQLRDPADRTSHCLLTWVVEGELDHAALAGAIAEVHRRHEPLRAAYLPDPRPAAQVVDIEPPPLEFLPRQPGVEAAVEALRELLSEPLDPTAGDVWRTALAEVDGGSVAVFGCVVHHIAFDGRAESVLACDLAAGYETARGGTRAAAPEPVTLAAAYRAYAARLDGAAAHHASLREELTGAPDLRWPDGATEPASGCVVEIPLAASVVAAVDALAAASGVSRFAVLLTCYATSLAEVTGQDDFVVGVPVVQRDAPILERAIGCHITMLPLRLRGISLAGVGAVGRLTERAFAAQDVPFPDLLRVAGTRPGERHPLFQTVFALQDNPVPELRLPGLKTTFLRQPYLDLPLELHTELWPAPGGGLLLTVHFRPESVPEVTAQEIAKRFADRTHTLRSGQAK
ncbi:amino acid adenylation protein [Amycolatopsis vancoresmycina DSM 44592]|uniref:Amino acid adenylation protein n=1 Tax=Amycolatopsis vancoresmycina DSM 44592 TaxID=1292037 RepID=R1HN03_9PSEU|nr:amino acid adenylation protein [Amycolatopsis vancoresmycina DSM 44592]